jgi:site-specific recombinase XerD
MSFRIRPENENFIIFTKFFHHPFTIKKENRMNRAHFALKLRKDRPKKDNTLGIYLYANINSKLSWYSTNHSVLEKQWNLDKQEVKSTVTNWSTINDDIHLFVDTAKKYISQCNIDGTTANSHTLDSFLRAAKYHTNSYYDFVEEYKKNHANNYAPKTLMGFQTHLNKLKEFRPKLDFNSIDIGFWNSYDSYLRGKDNMPNTIHKQSRQLKKFLNKAVEFGIIKENPLKNIKVKQNEGNREYLSRDEINRLELAFKKQKSKNHGKGQVLKYFLFACYTSLRYSDIKQLKFNHLINGNTIHLEMEKTGKMVSIPLSEKAKSLLPEKSLPNKPVFKVYTNQVTNRHLKTIAEDAEIEKELTFHCARHTWATITLDLTGDIALVSNVLGHADIKTTQIYAKVLEQKMG